MRKFAHTLFNIEHVFVVAIAGCMFGLFCLLLQVSSSVLDPMKRAFDEFELSDLYYQVGWHIGERPRQSADITLVDIGEMRSRKAIGDLLQAVEDCHPAVVGVDFLFEGRHDDARADSALSRTARGLRRTVFACKMLKHNVQDGSFGGMLKPYFAEDFAPKMGYVNAVGNIHLACLRKLSVERTCEGRAVSSLAACLADTYKKGCLPADRRENYLIGYKNVAFPVVKSDSVTACRDLLEGRIVLVGALNMEEDVQLTPLGKLPGLQVLAYSVQTLVNQQDIRILRGGVKSVLVFLLVAYLTVLWQWAWVWYWNRRPRPLFFFLGNSSSVINLLTIGWMAVLAWIGYLFYDLGGLYVSMAYLFAFIVLVCEARNLYNSIIETLYKFWRGTPQGSKFKDWFSALAARSIYVFQ